MDANTGSVSALTEKGRLGLQHHMSLSSPVPSVTFLGIAYRDSKQQEERITARILYSATTLPVSVNNELYAFPVGQVRTFTTYSTFCRQARCSKVSRY